VIGIVLALYLARLTHPQSPGTDSSRSSNESLPLDTTIISPQGVHISVRVAMTDEQRQFGLSYFKDLPYGQGMIFVFPQPGAYSFWMKDMNFPIDILWLDEKGVVVDRAIAVDPSSYPKSFTPKASAQFVLEIPANTADRDGFTIGAQVNMEKKM
jgi:uncharacterized membrane protein (UPF0127 family)